MKNYRDQKLKCCYSCDHLQVTSETGFVLHQCELTRNKNAAWWAAQVRPLGICDCYKNEDN